MKEKTSVTLSKEVLEQIDRLAGSRLSRSSFIERVLRRYILERNRKALHAKNLVLINAASERLNREAEDALGYQFPTD